MDTSPTKRQGTPDFYGYIPPTGRGLIFFLMTIYSTSQFLAKILAIALLGAVSSTWALAYLVGDLGVYILYKIVRGDLIYWIPLEGVSIIYGVAAAIMQKVRRVENA